MVTMETQRRDILLLIVLGLWGMVGGFSISTSTSDIGQNVDMPARSGQNAQEIRLTCDLQFNSGEKWTTCTWSHSFPEVWAYDNREAFVMCSATHLGDHGIICEDQGNLKDSYYGDDPLNNPYTQYDPSRLLYSVTDSSCGLTITAPHANDTGIWTCKVNDNNPLGQSTTMWSEVELFVATQSEVVISDPDLTSDPGLSLEVDLSSSSTSSIQAECTTTYSSPTPSLIWYIDDPSNELSEDVDENQQNDGSVVSTIRLQLDSNSISRYRVKTVNDNFAFSLGCYPDQGDYFDNSPDDVHNPAEVLVFGVASSALRPGPASMMGILLITVSSFLFL